jgi:hypothetical protein
VRSLEERWLSGSASVNTYRLAARDCVSDFSGCRAHRDLVFQPVVREVRGSEPSPLPAAAWRLAPGLRPFWPVCTPYTLVDREVG